MTVEEKTPKGYVLKINPKRLTFIAFDRLGATVYSGPHEDSTIHKVPVICFIGKQFILKQRMLDSYYLVKVSKNKLLVPYYVSGNKDRHYHLLETTESMDMVPIRMINAESVLAFIQLIEDGYRPDYILIPSDMPENDIIIFRNRYPKGSLTRIDLESEELVTQAPEPEKDDDSYFVNLNTMSTNPFFLVTIHLRDFKLSSVKQVLLDFDLDADELDNIVTYLEIVKKWKAFPKPDKNMPKLDKLITDFRFYRALITKQTDIVNSMIDEISSSGDLSSYMTILAKAKSVISESQPSDLDIVDYENRLYDKKEMLEVGAGDEQGGNAE
ncbi:MAG: hypothetical protein ACOC2H_08065 [Spirochaetota bacterium]